MWACPDCDEANEDTGVAIQACQSCGTSAVVEDSEEDVAELEQESTGWGSIIVVIALVLAGINYGPSLFNNAQEFVSDTGFEGAAVISADFSSFDKKVIDCVNAGDEPVYDVVRHYEFPYGGKTWTWQSTMSAEIHSCLANPDIRDNFGRFDYSQYVTARFDDQAMEGIIEKFRQVQMSEGYSDRQLAEMVLAFVQSLVYAVDDVTTPYDEWPRFPLETLYMRGGDCEDTSILYASLIRAMGYGAVMLAPPQHMAVGVPVARTHEGGVEHDGRFYAYAETTGEGYRIGDLPDEYSGAQIRIYSL